MSAFLSRCCAEPSGSDCTYCLYTFGLRRRSIGEKNHRVMAVYNELSAAQPIILRHVLELGAMAGPLVDRVRVF